ncbi:Low copy number virion structural protein [Bacillus toyonensis]|uniref:Low copy number virion structural protein n=1 Tax=Bacillus toyonensis TaxID=155322 RepID=UPI000BFD7000|nr:Low copy number virion structural protein [Bacillus toyonensis]PHG37469.1 Low copy number virion structural protein [Bacillus toyonensis]
MSFSVNYMAGGRFDAPYFPTKTEPYIEGRRIGIDDEVNIDEFSLSFDTEMISFSIAASLYSDRDYWNLYIDGKQVFKNVYVKDVPEGFNFSVIKPIPANAILKFEYHNKTGKQKVVKLNYQLLRD